LSSASLAHSLDTGILARTGRTSGHKTQRSAYQWPWTLAPGSPHLPAGNWGSTFGQNP
jgi:hypothetical protein